MQQHLRHVSPLNNKGFAGVYDARIVGWLSNFDIAICGAYVELLEGNLCRMVLKFDVNGEADGYRRPSFSLSDLQVRKILLLKRAIDPNVCTGH